MISNIYWINEKKIGEKLLGTMARPRGNDWLDDEIKWLKIRKIDYLICLLEDSELTKLGLNREKELCKKWKIQFVNLPIEDVNIPKASGKFIKLVEDLAKEIRQEKKVVIHCRMGIGRSSILAGAIMIKLGFEGKEVFEIISKYRKLEVPDTEEQRNWILQIENELK